MAGLSIFKTQQAVDAIISVDATLLALLGTGDADSIYDNPIQGESTPFPYIAYISDTAITFDTKTNNGTEMTLTIGVYSRTADKQETSTILIRLHDLLHNATLTVADNDFVLCRWDNFALIEEDDKSRELRTIQGTMRFRILTTEPI